VAVTAGTPPHPAAPAHRRRDAQNTRDRLVRAAVELFTTRGYHGTTTPEIARKAGIAEGTIYRHFSSKEQLLNELYRAALKLLEGAIQDAPPVNCRERLAAVARAWRAAAIRDPAPVRMAFFLRAEPILDARSRDAARRFREAVAGIIASGKAAGEVRAGSAELWADVWLGLVALVLDRTVSGDWPATHTAPEAVFDAAWEVIRDTARG
jgi:AcrR family transcriptional regulator